MIYFYFVFVCDLSGVDKKHIQVLIYINNTLKSDRQLFWILRYSRVSSRLTDVMTYF